MVGSLDEAVRNLSTLQAGTTGDAKVLLGHAKRKVGAAGTAAKTHVTRNKAVYIAGGAGLAAGAVGGAVLARRNKAKSEN